MNKTAELNKMPTQPAQERLPAIQQTRIPYHPMIQANFGIDRAQWKALVEAIFPNATSIESIILALSYCKARHLDPFKRNVHIVSVWMNGKYVDTIWPGIGELRTTAFRTRQYAGRGDTKFGPDITKTFVGHIGKAGQEREIAKTITFPEWAQVSVSRIVDGKIVEFAGPRVYWLETYASLGKSEIPNEMWEHRPRGQIDKCAEAAALRCGFPEELGSEYCAEEINGRTSVIDTTAAIKQTEQMKKLDDLAAKLNSSNLPEGELPPPSPEESERLMAELNRLDAEQANKTDGVDLFPEGCEKVGRK